MRFVMFTTISFDPTKTAPKRISFKVYDSTTDQPLFLNTYVAIDKIMSVTMMRHPEIEVRDTEANVINTIAPNTTAIRMVDGTTYYVQERPERVIVKIEEARAMEWQYMGR